VRCLARACVLEGLPRRFGHRRLFCMSPARFAADQPSSAYKGSRCDTSHDRDPADRYRVSMGKLPTIPPFMRNRPADRLTFERSDGCSVIYAALVTDGSVLSQTRSEMRDDIEVPNQIDFYGFAKLIHRDAVRVFADCLFRAGRYLPQLRKYAQHHFLLQRLQSLRQHCRIGER